MDANEALAAPFSLSARPNPAAWSAAVSLILVDRAAAPDV
jgi:hypothetical protein